jgi:hypothetical protein
LITAIDLRLGEPVTIICRHVRPGTTGKVERIALERSADGGRDEPMVTVLLDKPIVHPAMTLSDGTVLHEHRTYRQSVAAHEVIKYDARDAAIASLMDCVDLLNTLAPDAWQTKAARELLEKLGDATLSGCDWLDCQHGLQTKVLPAGEKAFTYTFEGRAPSRPLTLAEVLADLADDSEEQREHFRKLEVGKWSYRRPNESPRCEVRRIA